MGRPHLKFLGGRPPSPPLGLRPWSSVPRATVRTLKPKNLKNLKSLET